MPSPVDVAGDWVVTRYDELEVVTVESLDPDLPAGSDVTAAAADVTALAGPLAGGESAVGGGVVGQGTRDFTLLADANLTFAVKNRDRITRADGTQWITGDVEYGGFGALVICRDCVLQR